MKTWTKNKETKGNLKEIETMLGTEDMSLMKGHNYCPSKKNIISMR